MNALSDWSLDGKRLVLTVTPGRSGTGYLANLLSGLSEIEATHEPPPKFSDVMRTVQHEPQAAVTFWIEGKLPAIRSSEKAVYVETSHLACKGFIEPLLDHDLVPDLIILHRDPVLVATSLYLLDTIPARTSLGDKFLLRPDDPAVAQLRGWQNLHDWALCFWYCREIERRMRLYANMVLKRRGHVIATSIETLKTRGGVTELANFLGSQDIQICADDIQRRQHEIVNAKEKMPKPVLSPDLLSHWAGEVDSRLTE